MGRGVSSSSANAEVRDHQASCHSCDSATFDDIPAPVTLCVRNEIRYHLAACPYNLSKFPATERPQTLPPPCQGLRRDRSNDFLSQTGLYSVTLRGPSSSDEKQRGDSDKDHLLRSRARHRNLRHLHRRRRLSHFRRSSRHQIG